MAEQCNFKQFVKRVLYKISGLKILSFFICVVAIYGIILLHKWLVVSESLALRGLQAVEVLGVVLIGGKAIQNVAGFFRKGGREYEDKF